MPHRPPQFQPGDIIRRNDGKLRHVITWTNPNRRSKGGNHYQNGRYRGICIYNKLQTNPLYNGVLKHPYQWALFAGEGRHTYHTVPFESVPTVLRPNVEWALQEFLSMRLEGN